MKFLNKEIKTERLTVGSIEERDFSAMADIFTNEEIGRTYMLPAFDSREACRPLFDRFISLSSSEERFVRGIRLGDEIIGFMNDVDISNGEIELGYVIHPDKKNCGYATEALRAAIDFLFECGISLVKAGAFEENLASMRVMEKSGMAKIEYTETIEYKGKSHLCIFYAKSRD